MTVDGSTELAEVRWPTSPRKAPVPALRVRPPTSDVGRRTSDS